MYKNPCETPNKAIAIKSSLISNSPTSIYFHSREADTVLSQLHKTLRSAYQCVAKNPILIFLYCYWEPYHWNPYTPGSGYNVGSQSLFELLLVCYLGCHPWSCWRCWTWWWWRWWYQPRWLVPLVAVTPRVKLHFHVVHQMPGSRWVDGGSYRRRGGGGEEEKEEAETLL